MQLDDLLSPYTAVELPKVAIEALCNDSRQLRVGCLFLAERGMRSHALEHLSDAQVAQTAAIAYQPPYAVERFVETHKFVAVDNLNRHVSAIAKAFYAPRIKGSLIAVTGTNGKTSVTHFIAQLANYGVIGTLGYGDPKHLQELSHTTPDALTVQRLLATLASRYEGVAMEVSSHALSLQRVAAVDFSLAVFTNLSQDHLDFHGDMDAYLAAKSSLFAFASVKTAIVNVDGDSGYGLARQLQNTDKRLVVYGRRQRVREFAEYACLTGIELSHAGINAKVEFCLADYQATVELTTPVWGDFNADNVLAAVLALSANGYAVDTLLAGAQNLQGVNGRIEAVDLGDNKTAVIDYSHTPDALDSVLATLRAQTDGRLIAVFGCGGDRDRGKRPLMAEAVNRKADEGIITDDNPRTEQSADIIADILSADIDKERFRVLPSRREAIVSGLSALQGGDTLLIAGKGHEDYQIVGSEKHYFSDHAVVQEWLAEQHNAKL